MKKILALALALVMMLSAASALAEIPGFWNPPSVNEGQYPFSTEPIELTYWTTINAGAANFISSYDENPAYAKMQEDTGIDLVFQHAVVGMERDNFNTMMASGKLPDMILMPQTNYYEGGLKKMYDDGAIIDLTPYLEEYAPQYLACVNKSKISQKQIMEGDNGEILGFYRMSHAGYFPYYRMNVRADWLEEFNMKEPVTIAEYEAYLEAVKTQKGVDPLFLTFTSAGSANLLMGAFDIIEDYFVKDGKVGYFANTDEYRDFLRLMNEWYNKGYISKDFLSLTGTEVAARFDNGTLGMYPDSVDVVYARVKNLDIKATNLPYMRKEADSKLHSEGSSTPVDPGVACVTVITSACKNVEAAVAYLNYAYTYEGGLIANWGIEGLTWNWGEDGLPKFTEYFTANPDGMTTSNCSYALRCHLSSKYTYADNICGLTDEAQVANRSLWNNDPNVDSALRLPPINMTSEEITARTEKESEFVVYTNEMMIKFITGAASLDNDWDKYVETVNGMGLTEAIAITQAAYDRY